eukprot:6885-Heterococcus_DN1.PRE.2
MLLQNDSCCCLSAEGPLSSRQSAATNCTGTDRVTVLVHGAIRTCDGAATLFELQQTECGYDGVAQRNHLCGNSCLDQPKAVPKGKK